MIAEIASGLGSAKALFDLAKGLQAAATQAQVNEIKIALQEHVLNIQAALGAAQVAEATAASRIRELEQEIVRLKDWEREKDRYQLTQADVGAFAYTQKPGMEGGESLHWLCANCFKRGQSSVLQFQESFVETVGRRGVMSKWGCNCGSRISVAQGVDPTRPNTAGAAPPQLTPQPPKSDYDPFGP